MTIRRTPAVRLTITSLSLLLGTAATGCGDNSPGGGDDEPSPMHDGDVPPDSDPTVPDAVPDAEPPDAEPDSNPATFCDGPYCKPEDFPRGACEPGAFAEISPASIYNYGVGGFGWSSMRINVGEDETLDGAYDWMETDDVNADDNDAILRMDLDWQFYAVDICARGDDGRLRGTLVTCDPGGTSNCFEDPIILDQIRPLEPEVSSGVTYLGEYGPWPVVFFGPEGVTVNVRVEGDIAYLARYEDGLRILDISDPANVQELGHQPVDNSGFWNDVKIAHGPGDKTYALMGSSEDGIKVVDVTDPESPDIVETFPGPSNVHTLFVDDGKVYFTNIGAGLEIWDIADPANPTFLGDFPVPNFGFIHDLYVEGDRAYLNAWDEGMLVVDVSNPAAPTLLGTFVDYGHDTSHSSWVTTVGDRKIAVHGDEQRGSHVRIVDVTEGTPSFMDQIGAYQTREATSAHNLMAFGDLGVFSYYQDGLRLVDLSDPENPEQVGHYWSLGLAPGYGYWPFEGAIGVDVDLARDRIYLADTHRGLIILERDFD
jgi:hypothetical protein